MADYVASLTPHTVYSAGYDTTATVLRLPTSPTVYKMLARLVSGAWVSWVVQNAPDITGAQYTGSGTIDFATLHVSGIRWL